MQRSIVRIPALAVINPTRVGRKTTKDLLCKIGTIDARAKQLSQDKDNL